MDFYVWPNGVLLPVSECDEIDWLCMGDDWKRVFVPEIIVSAELTEEYLKVKGII